MPRSVRGDTAVLFIHEFIGMTTHCSSHSTYALFAIVCDVCLTLSYGFYDVMRLHCSVQRTVILLMPVLLLVIE